MVSPILSHAAVRRPVPLHHSQTSHLPALMSVIGMGVFSGSGAYRLLYRAFLTNSLCGMVTTLRILATSLA